MVAQQWRSQEIEAHRHILVITHQYISLMSVSLSKSRHQTTLISPPLVLALHGGSSTSLYEASFHPKIRQKGLEDQEKPRHGEVECHPMASNVRTLLPTLVVR